MALGGMRENVKPRAAPPEGARELPKHFLLLCASDMPLHIFIDRCIDSILENVCGSSIGDKAAGTSQEGRMTAIIFRARGYT